MPAASILFVTGKGGAGKTTVACALAAALAHRGERVLLVEPYEQRGLDAHFATAIALEPAPVATNLDAVRLQPRTLLERYFRKLLRLPFLARTLLSSTSFNALTAAAPGVSEFLILDRLDGWSRESSYDRLIVDGPATGHALQLLRAPFQLAGIASSGPLHRPLRRLIDALTHPDRVSVALVSLCEEMSVIESIEARTAALDQFGIAVERPILNRCTPRRFTRDDIRAIRAMDPTHPTVAAARLHIAAQHRTVQFAGRLKATFGRAPLGLPDLVTNEAALDELGRALLRGLKR
jgi:anion-transporting  ArsA/GET3 family ATPase